MLTLSDPAAVHLNSLLEDTHAVAKSAIRVIRKNGRFKLQVDDVKRDDVTFKLDGRVVLILDNAIAKRVSTRTMRVGEVAGKPRLKFTRG